MRARAARPSSASGSPPSPSGSATSFPSASPTCTARSRRAASGPPGAWPLGYRTDPPTKQLVIDEGAATAVRGFFSEAAKGTTTTKPREQGQQEEAGGQEVVVACGAPPPDEPDLRGPSPRRHAGPPHSHRLSAAVVEGAGAHRGPPHAPADEAADDREQGGPDGCRGRRSSTATSR